MMCYNVARDFLQSRKGKMIKLLVEGGGFTPITGKLVDFDDAVLVLEMEDGSQWMTDMMNVNQVADAVLEKEGFAAEGIIEWPAAI